MEEENYSQAPDCRGSHGGGQHHVTQHVILEVTYGRGVRRGGEGGRLGGREGGKVFLVQHDVILEFLQNEETSLV